MNKSAILSALTFTLVSAACMGAAHAAEAAAATSPTATSAAGKAWSPYQPVKAPDTPAVKRKAWVRTPADAFVLAQLEAKGLTPSPEADRATFIRRATLDAWGLLPTPQEIQAFVNDKSPKAYETLVDRLLASHHFGERQARPVLAAYGHAWSSASLHLQGRHAQAYEEGCGKRCKPFLAKDLR